jgi:hypothetical protein
MSGKSHVIRLSVPALVLAVGTCLALAGCGGGGSPPAAAAGNPPAGTTSGGIASGGSDSAACAAFAAAYKKFLAGYTGINASPLTALASAVADISSSGQLQQDLSTLGIDADLIGSGSAEGGITTPPSAFYADLQVVGKDCDTTFTRPPASLVVEG